jgi:CubicO group peptidase (beta-lactamase class C family)
MESTRKMARATLAVLMGSLAIGLLVIPPCADAQELLEASDPTLAAAIDSLRSTIPDLMRQDGVPGLAVAVRDASGRTLWEEAFGFTMRAGGSRVNSETLFSVQSISKVLTAMAVLVEVGNGRLSLDAPIGGYLPGLRLQSRFGPPPEDEITLRHLLSHHAGLTHEAPVGNNHDLERVPFAEHLRSIERGWLRFPVGERFSYSNLGFDLAAGVLEAVTGEAFPGFVQRALLNPIGLEHTTFDPERILEAPNRAFGHAEGFPDVPEITPMMGAGGAYSTASDLARLGLVHLQAPEAGAGPLLPPELLAEMHEIHRSFPDQTRGYGLGISVRSSGRSGKERSTLEHGGAGFGFQGALTIDREVGVVVAVLTNAQGHDLPARLTEDVLEAIRGASSSGPESGDSDARTRSPATDGLAHDSTFAGTYLYNGGGVMHVLWDGERLGVGTMTDFRPFTFVSMTEGWFQIGGERFPHRFVRGTGGDPAHLIRLYDGTWLDFAGAETPVEGSGVPASWTAHEGSWRLNRWGVPLDPFPIEVRGSSLFLAHLRLEEHEPGLFFARHGEVVDFRGPVPSWRGLPMERVD